MTDQMRLGETPPVRQDVAKCKGCGAPIIFVKTEAGERQGKSIWMPLNSKPERRIIIDKNQLANSVTVWIPHHSVCPKADEFRPGR